MVLDGDEIDCLEWTKHSVVVGTRFQALNMSVVMVDVVVLEVAVAVVVAVKLKNSRVLSNLMINGYFLVHELKNVIVADHSVNSVQNIDDTGVLNVIVMVKLMIVVALVIPLGLGN